MKTSQASFYLNVVLFFTLSGCLLIKEAYSSKQNCSVYTDDGLDIHFIWNSDHTGQEVGLEVSWWNITPSLNNFVSFWDEDPRYEESTPLEIFEVDEISAYKTLNWTLGNAAITLPKNVQNLPTCLSYWVTYTINDTIIHQSCLRLYPFWMEEIYNNNTNLRISNLFIPGVHLNRKFSSQSLWQQMVFGVRYFSMDILYDSENITFDVMYDSEENSIPLIVFLREINLFLLNTKEIILLDVGYISHSDFIEQGGLLELNKLLHSTFGGLILINNFTGYPLLETMLKQDQRLIVYSRLPNGMNSNTFWTPPNTINYTYTSHKELNDILPYDLYVKSKSDVPYVLEYTIYNTSAVHEFLRMVNHNLWNIVNIVKLPKEFYTSLSLSSWKSNIRRQLCNTRQSSSATHDLWKPNRWSMDRKIDYCTESHDTASKPQVWPTVKASPEESRFRLIQINWITDEVLSGDFIGLFDKLPSKENVLSLIEETLWKNNISINGCNQSTEAPAIHNRTIEPLYLTSPYATEGRITTDVQMILKKPLELSTGGCFSHWAVYIRQGSIVAHRCLASFPRWMWANRRYLGPRTLRSLTIPGTHNSGSYSVRSYIDPVVGWIVCQDVDVLTQLLLGVRYLDLRVSHYPSTTEIFWVNHGVIKWIPLQEVLNDIRIFTILSHDPVIVDIHRTPVGFDNETTELLLVSFIQDYLKDSLAESSIGSSGTLKQLWSSGKPIIVSYGDSVLRRKVPWLWPHITQAWANAQTFGSLRKFLDNEIEKKVDSPDIWAAMGHLTPSMWDFLLQSNKGTRGMADVIAYDISLRLKTYWKTSVNIITADYILSTDILWTSILLNLASVNCSSSSHLKEVALMPNLTTHSVV